MNEQGASLEQVSDSILTEIQGITGLTHNRLVQWAVRTTFGLPARRLGGMLVQLDRDTASIGLSAAVGNLLSRLVQDCQVEYRQAIPPDGPLLVVSNHPGAYDILLLLASLGRDDVKIISSDISILRHLPSVAPHFIPITIDPHRRMVAFRTALRHLQDGKAVLIFPRGNVEIDPALSPAAVEGIDQWSLSLDLFLRKVPQIRSVVAIVSGVFSARWFNGPILRLWSIPEQRQKIAEVLQVSEQLILSKKSLLTPRVIFSAPLTFLENREGRPGWQMEVLTQTARAQLATITG